MCSTSRISASSSIVVPRVACSCSSDRTASAISLRPPYPTATFTSRPPRLAVTSAASFSTWTVSAGSRSSAPTGFTCQPSATSSRTVSSMIRSRDCSSPAGRARLSVDSSHRVTTSTPSRRHHWSSSKILSAPFWCPPLTSVRPDWRAHLRLPSRSEEHTSELQSHSDLVCRLLLETKKKNNHHIFVLKKKKKKKLKKNK